MTTGKFDPSAKAPNADKLDGLDSGDFAPAAEVHSPGRVVLNDPFPGDVQGPGAILFTAGPFTIGGLCRDDSGGNGQDEALLVVDGPPGSSVAIQQTARSDPSSPDFPGFAVVAGILDFGNKVEGGHLTAVAPNGEVVSVSGTVEVGDAAGDCIFGATGIGP